MVAVVIPCYKVKKHILSVLEKINSNVSHIYVVDDACPENTGMYVQDVCSDSRVKVIFHRENLGVGGAVKSGYQEALENGALIIVKLDGDNQMNPMDIDFLIKPIIDGRADYTKGNRFFDLEFLSSMPPLRIFGNSLLSLFCKGMSGYWNIMDPTNGYTAIHSDVLKILPLKKIDSGYFFESDMLFRLGIIRAVVRDVSLPARYGGEKSNLRIFFAVREFSLKYFNRSMKRFFYNYLLRDFNIGTIEFIFGGLFFFFGLIFGAVQWFYTYKTGYIATSGTVMIATLPIILGFQLLISAINYDISNIPRRCLHKDISKNNKKKI